MASRNPAQMAPEELAAKVEALKPEWAKQYILQLEGITRHLAGQVTVLESRVTELRNYPDERPDPDEPGWIPPGQAGNPESAAWLSGITPPSGDWTVVRVLDGAAGMEPLADLPHKAEIRFVDAYQVHYGAHESTGGARVLIVETDNAMQVRPISPTQVLIVAMGG